MNNLNYINMDSENANGINSDESKLMYPDNLNVINLGNLNRNIILTKIKKLRSLLQVEIAEEVKAKNIQIANNPHLKLRLILVKEDYVGRFLIKLKPKEKSDKKLLLKKGDNAFLYGNQIGPEHNLIAEGIIVYIDKNNMSILVDTMEKIRIKSILELSAANEELKTFSSLFLTPTPQLELIRMNQALNIYENMTLLPPEAQRIISIIANDQINPSKGVNRRITRFRNENLNEEQKQMVIYAVNQKELALIQGPPGTGKTITIIEIILQEIKKGNKVIACAPSNVSADNITEKLSVYMNKNRFVRVGHPGRQNKRLIMHSLDQIISDKIKRKEKKKCVSKIESYDLKIKIINDRDVIICTLSGAMPKKVSQSGASTRISLLASLKHPRVVIIDECCQSTEVATWMPLHVASKLILAGDFKQLPPTVLTKKKSLKGEMEMSLMEKLYDRFTTSPNMDLKIHTQKLIIQYRMNRAIMNWPSKTFYNDDLLAHESVENHLLKDINGIRYNKMTSNALILIDTRNSSEKELAEPNFGTSMGNQLEADIVFKAYAFLIRSNLFISKIGIITPYNFQVQLINHKFVGTSKRPEIASVDKYQGQEKEAIILSMVRSNCGGGSIGFLKESRRLNVAVTRPRRLLVVICDTSTVCSDATIESFINYMRENALNLMPEEFTEDQMLNPERL